MAKGILEEEKVAGKREPQLVQEVIQKVCKNCREQIFLFDDGLWRHENPSYFRSSIISGHLVPQYVNPCPWRSDIKIGGDGRLADPLSDDEISDILFGFKQQVEALPPFSGYPTICPSCGFTHVPITQPERDLPQGFGFAEFTPLEWMHRTCRGCSVDWYEQKPETDALPNTFVCPSA